MTAPSGFAPPVLPAGPAIWSPISEILTIPYANAIASLAAINPAAWQLQVGQRSHFETPSAWAIVPGGLQVSGWVNRPGGTETFDVSWSGLPSTDDVNGATLAPLVVWPVT